MFCALCRLMPDHKINQACRDHLATGTPTIATIILELGVAPRTLQAHLAHVQPQRPRRPTPAPTPQAPVRALEGRLSLVERAAVVHRYAYGATDEASLRLAVRSLANLSLALAAAVAHPKTEEEN